MGLLNLLAALAFLAWAGLLGTTLLDSTARLLGGGSLIHLRSAASAVALVKGLLAWGALQAARFVPLGLLAVLALPDREGRLTGFRLPNHPLARGLVREAGVPLLVPSANVADEPPGTTAEQVLAAFPTELDLVIDGGSAAGGVPSTVVRVTDDGVEVLREAAIPEAAKKAKKKRT